MRHTQGCAIIDQGPCTCGAEDAYQDALDDEMREEFEADAAQEARDEKAHPEENVD